MCSKVVDEIGGFMKQSKIEVLKKLKNDIINGTSHCVDYLLSEETEKTISIKGIKIRKVFSPFLRMVYLTQTKYKLKKDDDCKKIKTNKGKIFVLNHRQADDIVLGANAIGESGYIVFGNKDLALNTTNGLGLWAYGMILLDRDNPVSRKSTYEKMKYVIENGGNIIIYPEGYWNLNDNGKRDERHDADDHNSENWLIQDINVGAIRLAKETGSPIIPIILHYDEFKRKMCYSKKGTPLYVNSNDNIFEKKQELLEKMYLMYYELMEKYSSYDRKSLETNGKTLKEQWEILKQELIADCDIKKINYKLDLDDEKLIGKAKVVNPITTNEEVFEHLDNLNFNKNNVFLLNKKFTGRY